MKNDTNIIYDMSIANDVFVARSENYSMYTTSTDIADKFEKAHKNVLSAIQKLCSDPDISPAFHKCSYKDTKGREQTMYKITRTGFTFLVMGFTGPKAMEWKKKYEKAFRMLEEQNRSLLIALKGVPVPGTPEFLARAVIEANKTLDQYKKRVESQEQQIRIKDSYISSIRPLAVLGDAISGNDDGILVKELAAIVTQAINKHLTQDIHIGEKKMFAWLRNKGYITKSKARNQNWPMQEYIDRGYFTIKMSMVTGRHTYQRATIHVTGRGQKYFVNKMVNEVKLGNDVLADCVEAK